MGQAFEPQGDLEAAEAEADDPRPGPGPGPGGVRGQGGVDTVGHAAARGRRLEIAPVVEGDHGGVSPDAAPAAGEGARARRVGGAWEADQDVVEEVVGEAADAVTISRLVSGSGIDVAVICAHDDR